MEEQDRHNCDFPFYTTTSQLLPCAPCVDLSCYCCQEPTKVTAGPGKEPYLPHRPSSVSYHNTQSPSVCSPPPPSPLRITKPSDTQRASAVMIPSPSTSPTLRMLTRRPALTIAGLALAGACLGFKHVSKTLHENEQAQKNAARNLYVSVDRSGGGV
ncbi:hypothetical protein BT67DRAFT_316192 [Trichocladium antarcticum]|uniref:Uncharacterized protein n=1 Tax=Trichocladium antarcticum TaxID=1450529 RepID=A0AAN6UJU7_9PEZI|nr:hypothetical protein BT67DRAFT_316192 [Trichocladium antarcticum]